jgi:hypothetical protein
MNQSGAINMAFQQQENVTITGFEDISINLFVPGVSNIEGIQSGAIEIQLMQSDGRIKTVSADLLARLGDDAEGLTHRANLLAMRDYILARIPLEVLP